MAEYRELPMIHGALRRTLKSAKGFQPSKVSPHYTLNSGHVYFFFDKKEYLLGRFNKLVAELRFRGYDINPDSRTIDWSVFDYVPQISWSPRKEDHLINVERIAFRISQKPHLYRWTKRKVPVYSSLF